MLTYTPQSSHQLSHNAREYSWALLLLAFAWLWPGVFSHDLWKLNEPQLYQVIAQFAQQPSWQPMLFEQPYFSVAPVYIWVASAFQQLLSPWAMDEFSAARFASVLFTTIGLLASGIAGFRLLGKHQGRSVPLILIGSVGLLPIAHFLNGSSVVLAAIGLIFWAFSILHKQLVWAIALCALAQVGLFQAGGLILPLAVWLVMALLCCHAFWRSNRLFLFIFGTLLVALPLMAVYPLSLRVEQPEIFMQYVQQHLWGAWGGNRSFQAAFSLFYYLKHLLWFAFPALPLAIWTFWRLSVLKERFGVLLCVWLAVMTLILATMPRPDQDWLILLLVPLAILGAAQLDSLRRGAAAFLNWFGIMTFSLMAVFLWLGFAAMNFGFPAKLAERAAYFSPYYTRDLDFLPIFFATLFTPIWLMAISRRHIRGRQAVTNWAAGITLVWALLMTLFLPWLDAAKSFRPVVQNMQSKLPEPIRTALVNQEQCLWIAADDLTTRLAWQQYGTLKFYTQAKHLCRYQLRLSDSHFTLPENTALVWQGSRPRSKNEVFVLIDHLPN